MDTLIGIDFGTTNSVVCEWRDGAAHVVANDLDEATTPSVVTLQADGTLAFGRVAREQFRPERSLRSIKRVLGQTTPVRLGEREWRSEAIAAMLFKKLKHDAEARLHAPVTRAVITVPANSKGHQRTATKVAAKMAGIQTLTLINEPTAAAMAYGVRLDREQTLLVYDFGGGTFDVTVLRVHNGLFEELSSKGVRLLGGDDLDQALFAWAVEVHPALDAAELAAPEHAYWTQRLLLALEEAKIRLSERDTASVRIPGFLGRLQLELAITRDDLDAVAAPFVAQSLAAVDEALRAAGLAAAGLDGVLLVGGTSKMPLVRRMLEAHLGVAIPSASGVDPLTCVAEGAAIAAGIIQRAPDLSEHDYVVRLEHSLCADPADPLTMKRFLDPIIARGSAIPITATHTYYPIVDYTDWINVEIYEGDVTNDLDHPDNAKLLSLHVPIDPPRPADEAGVAVRLSYGEDGILDVTVTDVTQNKTLTHEAVTFAQAALTEDEQAESVEAIGQLFQPRPQPFERPASALVASAEATLAKVESAEEAAPLRAAIAALKGARGEAAVRAAEDALRDELLAFAYLSD